MKKLLQNQKTNIQPFRYTFFDKSIDKIVHADIYYLSMRDFCVYFVAHKYLKFENRR